MGACPPQAREKFGVPSRKMDDPSLCFTDPDLEGWSSSLVRTLLDCYRPILEVKPAFGVRAPAMREDLTLGEMVHVGVEYPRPHEPLAIPDEHVSYGVSLFRQHIEHAINVAGIDATITDTLSTRGTRPAVFFYDPGYSLNLRGVNLNAENDPADMISVRFWVTNNMVITLRNQRLQNRIDLHLALGGDFETLPQEEQ